MVETKRGVEADAFRRNAEHTLFVEGHNDEAIDPIVLSHLLKGIPLRIRPMGPSSHIRSVAEALHWHHPHYYFLVDRDHHDDHIVEKCWQDFPLESASNLLIWRRRELENYFLIPEYICKSKYIKCSYAELQERIIQEARKRIFLDAANLVIIGLREELKKSWIEVFSDIRYFNTREHALEQLLTDNRIPQKISNVGRQLHRDAIEQRFDEIVAELFGGNDTLQYDYGSWLERVSGKDLLKIIVNTCFQVKPAAQILQGKEALLEFVKDLLKRPLLDQPSDFQELHRLVSGIMAYAK